MNIEDVCKNREILENGCMNAPVREKNIKELDFAKIREQLTSEIDSLSASV